MNLQAFECFVSDNLVDNAVTEALKLQTILLDANAVDNCATHHYLHSLDRASAIAASKL